MSADNYILIDRKTNRVSMMCASSGEEMYEMGIGKTLDDAIDIADKEPIVEYGIHFTESTTQFK